MNIVKAKRAIVLVGDGISLEALMMPDGSFRLTLTSAAQAVGYTPAWLSNAISGTRLMFLEKTEQASILFSGDKQEVVLEDGGFKGLLKVKTISLLDFLVLVAYAVVEGKEKSIALVDAAFSESSSLSTKEKLHLQQAINAFHKSKIRVKTRKRAQKTTEKDVQMKLAARLNGEVEVACLAGRIDILTTTEIIEVKINKDWKGAIGQVLVYGHYFPNHTKRIHLIGKAHCSFKEMIESSASKLGVKVTWED